MPALKTAPSAAPGCCRSIGYNYNKGRNSSKAHRPSNERGQNQQR